MVERIFTGCKVSTLDEPFLKGEKQYSSTANVQFFNDKKELLSERKLGYISQEEAFLAIDKRGSENLPQYEHCLIENFSLSKYRETRNLPDDEIVNLEGFEATNCLFLSEDKIDFSKSSFGKAEVCFNNSIFGTGEVSFSDCAFGDNNCDFEYCYFVNGDVEFTNSVFGEGEVSFKNAIFGEGRKNFEKVDFGTGPVIFINSEFGEGEISFANACNESGRISFKVSRFGKGKIDFSHVNFGDGELIFEKAIFGEGDIVFRTAHFGDGKVDFTRAQFGDGRIDFSNAVFGVGNVAFVNTEFDTGKISFKLTNFNGGKIDFHFASFGAGDLIFERTLFGNGLIDFRTAAFNEGKVMFNRVEFGNGDILLEASEMKSGKMIFKNSIFSRGNLNFEMAAYENADVIFENVDFGSTDVSFNRSRFNSLIIESSHLNNYFNIRVEKCFSLNIVNSIIRDIVDIQPTDFNVSIAKMDMSGMRLLGRIYIGWRQINVKDLIYSQNTSLRNKSEQFRMLKENYNSIGQYVEEDEAYVEFKRTELTANYKEAVKRANDNFISRLRNFQLHNAIKNSEKIPHEKKAELMFIIKSSDLTKINNNEDFVSLMSRMFGYNRETLKEYKETVFKDFKVEEEIKKKQPLFRILSSPPFLFQRLYAWLTYWSQWLIFDKIGLYATDPLRVLMSMVFVYWGFTLIYMILPMFGGSEIISSLFDPGDPRELSYIGKAFYHSAITFLTIGYGDYYPNGMSRWMSSIEGFTGLFLMSYFTVAFVRKILR